MVEKEEEIDEKELRQYKEVLLESTQIMNIIKIDGPAIAQIISTLFASLQTREKENIVEVSTKIFKNAEENAKKLIDIMNKDKTTNDIRIASLFLVLWVCMDHFTIEEIEHLVDMATKNLTTEKDFSVQYHG